MQPHTKPLSKEICDSIDPRLYQEFLSLGVTKILDIKSFIDEHKREPCVSSIFLVGENSGGSYVFEKDGFAYAVHNGTLVVPYDILRKYKAAALKIKKQNKK
jgi:hypothetical protein